MQQYPQKHKYIYAKRHGVKPQKTGIFKTLTLLIGRVGTDDK